MKSRIGSNTINYGVYLGVFYMIMTMVLYLIGVKYFIGWPRLVTFVLMLGVGIFLAIRVRKEDFPARFSFSNAFLNTLIILVIAEVGWTLLYWVLYNVINPDLASQVKVANIENTLSLMNRFGAPEDRIEETMETLREADYHFNLKAALLSLLIWTGVYALISLIVGAIIKRKGEEVEIETVEG